MSLPPGTAMRRVAVVGGGLAGLVAARHLADAGREVTVFEREPTVGGRVRSREVEGFTLDRGFQVLFTSYPDARRELDLDALDLRTFPPGAIVARPGRRSTVADPLRDPGAALETLRSDAGSLGDKLRLLALALELRWREYGSIFPGPDRSIREALARRGFSERFVDAFVAPFYGGITLDRSLSTAAAVFEYTFKALAEGQAAVPAAGMGAIPDQLAERARSAGATIETGRAVTGLSTEEGGPVTVELDGETVEVDAAVVATDPSTARELTGVNAIPTEARGCVTQYYALPVDVSLDTGGRLLLNADGDAPNHVAPLSAVAPEYAPEGRQLLAATFLGRDVADEADEAELAELSRSALASWYPDRRFDELSTLATDRIPFAQFDQPPGSHAGLPAIDAPDGPVVLAGDYTRWSSIQGALRSGRLAAHAVRAAGP
ncbi:MAG: NAD(P)/FAD-dependent oxidoreductase [Halobacteriales archaeon]|nr:NAD(P)/FAD-dependent oxidoreductase [Halobacteriales archaeon]